MPELGRTTLLRPSLLAIAQKYRLRLNLAYTMPRTCLYSERYARTKVVVITDPEPEHICISKDFGIDLYEWDSKLLCIQFPINLQLHLLLRRVGCSKIQESEDEFIFSFEWNSAQVAIVMGIIISKVYRVTPSASQRIPLTGIISTTGERTGANC